MCWPNWSDGGTLGYNQATQGGGTPQGGTCSRPQRRGYDKLGGYIKPQEDGIKGIEVYFGCHALGRKTTPQVVAVVGALGGVGKVLPLALARRIAQIPRVLLWILDPALDERMLLLYLLIVAIFANISAGGGRELRARGGGRDVWPW